MVSGRAGHADLLHTSALISVNVVPVALTAASTKISAPSGVSAAGKFASGAPPYSLYRRARALVKPAL